MTKRHRAVVAAAVMCASIALTAGLAAGAQNEPRAAGACEIARFAACAGHDFTLGDIHTADLRGADLRAASFNGAFMYGASLAGADLRSADLRGTTMTSANLESANLAGANLADASMRFANVGGGALSRAFLCRTVLPDGSRSNRDCADSAPRLAMPAEPEVALDAARSAPPPVAPVAPLASPRRFPSLKARIARKQKKRKGKKVKVTMKVEGFGQVSAASGGIDCPGKCTAKYKVGQKLTFVATPGESASFAGWQGRCLRKGGSCVLKVHKPSRITAKFAGGCAGPDVDADSDGLSDCREVHGWTINVRTPADLSGGGSSTRKVTSDPHNPDTDGDGVRDDQEFAFNGDARSGDTDFDALGDAAELVTYRSDLNDADTDNDSVPAGGSREAALYDGNEVTQSHTNPRNDDTDGDSLTDYYEIILASGPANPRVANLPQLSLEADPDTPNVKIDLPYTVTTATGTDQEAGSVTGHSSEQTTSNGGSSETTHEETEEHQAGGSCHLGVADGAPDIGCEVSYEYTNSQTDGQTDGTDWGLENSSEISDEYSETEQKSSESEVEFAPSGCIQVLIQLHNTGSVGVTVDDFQVLASTPDPENPGQSRLLATLLPVNGTIYTGDCPATASDFPSKTIPPTGTESIGFAAQVDRDTLREYQANPTPISFRFGAISMKGTNLANQPVDFLGDVATKVGQRDASVQVDFGDGTIKTFNIAAGTELDASGRPIGVTLGDALSTMGFAPQYTSDDPRHVRSLKNPNTNATLQNNDSKHAFWSLYGDSAGIGANTTDWGSIRLRPGDAVSVAYRTYSDSDTLSDQAESLLGTNILDPDTDGDDLRDDLESLQGWTVPLVKNGQASYHVYSSPVSCDADGDKSPDGPGEGKAPYGPCPTGEGPEATRGDEDASLPSDSGPLPINQLEGTDPNRADTNADGLLDGNQDFPDVLKQAVAGSRLPVFVRQWGGPGQGTGTFTHAQGIAVDVNKPMFTGSPAAPNPGVSVYVVDRKGDTTPDVIQKFTGNPLTGAPIYERGLDYDKFDASPSENDFVWGAAGIAVGAGNVQATGGPNSGVQGSPVVANFYPKHLYAHDFANDDAFLTTFNGTTGEDMYSYGDGTPGSEVGFNMAFTYGSVNAAGDFSPRKLPSGFPDPRGFDKGTLDLTAGNDPIVGHGFGATDAISADTTQLPTQYLENQSKVRYGNKTATSAVTKLGQIIDPSGIAIDRTGGDVYAADDLADLLPRGTITRFDIASGVADRFIASPSLDRVRNIAIDPSGDFLYAAAGPYILKLSPDLSILGRFGGPAGPAEGGGQGGTIKPFDVDIDDAHGAWVTDSSTNLVQYFYFPFGPA